MHLPPQNVSFFISPRKVFTSGPLFYQVQRNKIEKANIWLWAFKIPVLSSSFLSAFQDQISIATWVWTRQRFPSLKQTILLLNHKQNLREAQDHPVQKTRKAHPAHCGVVGAGKTPHKPQQNAFSVTLHLLLSPLTWQMITLTLSREAQSPLRG